MQQAGNTVGYKHADSSVTPGYAGVKGSRDRQVIEVLSCACLSKNAACLQIKSSALTSHWNETEKTVDSFHYFSIYSILEQKYNDFLRVHAPRPPPCPPPYP